MPLQRRVIGRQLLGLITHPFPFYLFFVICRRAQLWHRRHVCLSHAHNASTLITAGLCGFYRATRMHSADYAVARCLSVRLSVRPSVRLSVRLSHAGIVSKQLHISSKYQTGWQYSDGDPLTGASNARGYEKNHDFRPISRFISQTMQDEP